MENSIKELKSVRKSIEKSLDAVEGLVVAEKTVKDLKEVQTLIESVIRRNKALLNKGLFCCVLMKNAGVEQQGREGYDTLQ